MFELEPRTIAPVIGANRDRAAKREDLMVMALGAWSLREAQSALSLWYSARLITDEQAAMMSEILEARAKGGGRK